MDTHRRVVCRAAGSNKCGPVFERLTDPARKALVVAQNEATRLGHNAIGTEHLLLGLIEEQRGAAFQVLSDSGVSVERVRERVAERLGEGSVTASTSPQYTPGAKEALEFALREAVQVGDDHIGTEHLLLGLLRETDGAPAQVLLSLGVDLTRIRSRILERGGVVHSWPEFGSISAPMTGPVCPRCGRQLRARCVTTNIPVDDESPGGQRTSLQATIAYCSACGGTLGLMSSSRPVTPPDGAI